MKVDQDHTNCSQDNIISFDFQIKINKYIFIIHGVNLQIYNSILTYNSGNILGNQ